MSRLDLPKVILPGLGFTMPITAPSLVSVQDAPAGSVRTEMLWLVPEVSVPHAGKAVTSSSAGRMRFRRFSKVQGSFVHTGGARQRRFGLMLPGSCGPEAHGRAERSQASSGAISLDR